MAGARTVHLTNAWHPTSGGISTFYRNLLVRAGHSGRCMTLIVPGERTYTEEVTGQARIIHVEARLSRIAGGGYRTMWPLGRAGRIIVEALREAQPDLVEVSDKYALALVGGFLQAGWAGGLRLRPVLVGISHERMHDNVGAYLKLAPMFSDLLCRLYLKHFYWLMFDHHVANSEYTASELRPASRGHRAYRWLHVMPMGVDASRFDPALRTPKARQWLLQRTGCPVGARLLLYAGRLAEEKNIPLLVNTLGALGPAYHLTVAGDGKLREWLRNAGNTSTPGRIHFTGHLTGSELVSVLAGADAFVHPNPAEPFGIAPLEAMAAGTPVVLPRAGGVLSYASDENAWLAEPNSLSFARTVDELFRRSDVAGERAARARATAVGFDWGMVAVRWFNLYDAVVDGLSLPWTMSAHR